MNSKDHSPPYRRRWLCLALGALWGVLAMLVVLNLHVDPDNLRNSEGALVMQTVYARDSVLWLANFLAIGAVIAVAAVELAVRTHRKSKQPGVVAYVLGALLCAYSLFGLLYGVAAIAPIGLMIIVSGIPVTTQRVAVTQSS